MYRKTNIGALIIYDSAKASRELLKLFSKKGGMHADVATHYGVATTTVRRWVSTLLSDHNIDITARIDRIRELAIELEV